MTESLNFLIIGALICRHIYMYGMKLCCLWSYSILAPSSLLWSQLLLVAAFHDIYEISLCVLQRDQCSFSGPDCRKSSSVHCTACEYLSFLNGAHPRFSVTLHDLDMHGHWWQQGDLTSSSLVGAAGGRLGQPRRGLTLVCVFALAPCQGKENTWSWSPVLSADIFGKGCWIQVCVWSYASPSQVKHRETQRLLHFSV